MTSKLYDVIFICCTFITVNVIRDEILVGCVIMVVSKSFQVFTIKKTRVTKEFHGKESWKNLKTSDFDMQVKK